MRGRRRKTKRPLLLGAAVFAGCLGAVVLAILWPAPREPVGLRGEKRAAPAPVATDLTVLLSRLLEDRRVEVQPASGPNPVLVVRAPAGRSLYALQAAVTRAAPLWGAKLEPGREVRLPSGERAVDLVCARGPERVRLRMTQTLPPASPRVALVLDDFGFRSKDLLDGFLRLDVPFTPAVLPGYPRSQESMRRLGRGGRAPILHLPMDPKDLERNQPGPGVVRSSMTPEEIRGVVAGHLEAFDGVVGVSQHMGSRGSEETRVAGPAMYALAEKGLFFLDSGTSPRSVLPAEAALRGVRCLTADVFLDGDPQPTASTMAGRLSQACQLAREAGSAIVVGHARRGTLEFLQSVSDSLPSWGCRFVPLAELLR